MEAYRHCNKKGPAQVRGPESLTHAVLDEEVVERLAAVQALLVRSGLVVAVERRLGADHPALDRGDFGVAEALIDGLHEAVLVGAAVLLGADLHADPLAQP